MSATRTPEEIRRSIEANRAELAVAVETLRGEVTKATDWRASCARTSKEVSSARPSRASSSAAASPRSPACSRAGAPRAYY